MAVAFDAATESATWTTTPDPFTFTHTPAGTPRAAILYIVHPAATLDIDGMPSYGGTPFTHAWPMGGTLDNEPGRVYCYFLDNVPSGAQTVSIPHTASANVKIATCITVTAGGPVFPVGTQLSQAIGGNPAASLTVGNVGTGANALRFYGAFSGTNAPGNLTPTANTTLVSDHDFGNNVAWISREDSESTTRSMGYTGTSDDFASVLIAVSETEEPRVDSYRMAFPGATTAHAATLPATVDADDLLLFNFATSINGGTITPTGGPTLTRFDDDTNLGTMVAGFWWVACDGSEDAATVDFVTNTATNANAILHMYHVPASFRDVTQDPECTVTGPTASGTPDPAGLTPSWGSADNLWLVSLVRDQADGISSLGADYVDRFVYSVGSATEAGTSFRYNTATSEDPGTSTVGSTDEEFKAYVVAVKPEADDSITGTGASTLEDVESDGAGTYTPAAITGTGTSTLGDVTSAGAGTYTPAGITGTGASTLAGVTSAGVGVYTPQAITGSGTSTLDDVTSAGAGTVIAPITGTGTSTLGDVTSAGVGVFAAAGNIGNVVCDVIGLNGVCDELAPVGTCTDLAPLVTCGVL